MSKFSWNLSGSVTLMEGSVAWLTILRSVHVFFSFVEFFTEFHTAGQHGKYSSPHSPGKSEDINADLILSLPNAVMLTSCRVIRYTVLRRHLWKSRETLREMFSIIKTTNVHIEKENNKKEKKKTHPNSHQQKTSLFSVLSRFWQWLSLYHCVWLYI